MIHELEARTVGNFNYSENMVINFCLIPRKKDILLVDLLIQLYSKSHSCEVQQVFSLFLCKIISRYEVYFMSPGNAITRFCLMYFQAFTISFWLLINLSCLPHFANIIHITVPVFPKAIIVAYLAAPKSTNTISPPFPRAGLFHSREKQRRR